MCLNIQTKENCESTNKPHISTSIIPSNLTDVIDNFERFGIPKQHQQKQLSMISFHIRIILCAPLIFWIK